MTRWLAAAKAYPHPNDKTDNTDETHAEVEGKSKKHNHREVLSVSSVLSKGVEPVFQKAPARSEPRSDADEYADALRYIGPCGYGPIAVFLGWGATRTANAEEVLRKAGRIIYDHTGRGMLR